MSTSAKLFSLLAMVAMAATAAEGLRNPFWPKGYVGEMTPISADVRPKKPKSKPKPKVDTKAIAAAKAAKEAAAKEAAAKKAAAKEAAAREAAAKEAAEKEVAAKAAAAKAAKEAAERLAREAAEQAEADRKREVTSEDWKKAMKSLKIGNPAVITTQDGKTRSTISINGNIYGDGDLMSVTYDSIRFTWRIKGLAGGEKLKLERLRARRVK